MVAGAVGIVTINVDHVCIDLFEQFLALGCWIDIVAGARFEDGIVNGRGQEPMAICERHVSGRCIFPIKHTITYQKPSHLW